MAHDKIRTRYDAIIVGSGIAGLLLALELDAGGMRTALICKGRLLDSNTSWAQGGVAICTPANPLDTPEQHLKDTLSAGAGLCDEGMARRIIEGGFDLYKKLEKLGLNFDRTKNGALELAREGGHCQSRVLHSKDASGRAIAETLVGSARSCRKLAVFEHMFAIDLLMSGDHCIGLRVLQDETALEILAPRVVLASGGLGQVFARTTNPAIATGDGIAMAYRAGAKLIDMEFVQFHPTALCLPGAPASLISEAVRGAGAHLLDAHGDRFAFRFHKSGELATRDVVSRAILSTMKEQKITSVSLDMRPIGATAILEKYPNIVNACRNLGIDPLERPIPVSPAAHYFMGGIWTDQNCRTSVPGLYALGECAATGLHGANRLASNSLLEGGVMALQAARSILNEMSTGMPKLGATIEESLLLATDAHTVQSIDQFRKDMFAHAGLIRDGKVLAELVMDQFAGPFNIVPMEQPSIEAANIGLVGTLIARSALVRCESRGAHWRSDFPFCDDANFKRRYFVSNNGSGFEDVKSDLSLKFLPDKTASARTAQNQ